MNVLIIEPGKVPREAEIGSGLKAMQDIVGGYILTSWQNTKRNLPSRNSSCGWAEIS